VTNFGDANVLGVPAVAWVLLLMVIAVYFLLEHTPFGRQLYALGSNPTAANLVGLRTRQLTGIAFVIAGTISGAAGIIYVARAGGADPGVGPSFTLAGLAAAFLSAAAVRPGRFNVGGAIVAVFFLATINNGLDLAGVAPYVASYVNGSALIGGVALAMWLSRRRTR
jgi:ribose transport system permease protein